MDIHKQQIEIQREKQMRQEVKEMKKELNEVFGISKIMGLENELAEKRKERKEIEG